MILRVRLESRFLLSLVKLCHRVSISAGNGYLATQSTPGKFSRRRRFDRGSRDGAPRDRFFAEPDRKFRQECHFFWIFCARFWLGQRLWVRKFHNSWNESLAVRRGGVGAFFRCEGQRRIPRLSILDQRPLEGLHAHTVEGKQMSENGRAEHDPIGAPSAVQPEDRAG